GSSTSARRAAKKGARSSRSARPRRWRRSPAPTPAASWPSWSSRRSGNAVVAAKSSPPETLGSGVAAPAGAPRSAGDDQERGADRASEVAQRGDAHGWRALVDEQVLAHLVVERLHEPVPEPDPEPAADDYRLRVDQVDGGGDPGPER